MSASAIQTSHRNLTVPNQHSHRWHLLLEVDAAAEIAGAEVALEVEEVVIVVDGEVSQEVVDEVSCTFSQSSIFVRLISGDY